MRRAGDVNAKVEKLYWVLCFSPQVIIFSFLFSFFTPLKFHLRHQTQSEQTNMHCSLSKPTTLTGLLSKLQWHLSRGAQTTRAAHRGNAWVTDEVQTNPHVVFLLHRCVQGLSFCHASHLCQSLKSLSLSFCSWFIQTKFSMATVQKLFQGNYFVKLQTLSLPLVHNNLSIIVACYKATSYSLSRQKLPTFLESILNTTSLPCKEQFGKKTQSFKITSKFCTEILC